MPSPTFPLERDGAAVHGDAERLELLTVGGRSIVLRCRSDRSGRLIDRPSLCLEVGEEALHSLG